VKGAVATGRSWRLLTIRAVGGVTGATVVLVVVLAVRAGGSGPAAPQVRPLPAPVTAAGLLQRSGVRVVRVASSGGGGLLDLRFQVVDPGRAGTLHDRSTPPAVVDEKSGAVLARLLMDHMPHGRPKAGVTYYMLFLNTGNLVRRGDLVGVVLGNARLAHVPVS
jgi:hypothetical protein